jgi:hypothetical protein
MSTHVRFPGPGRGKLRLKAKNLFSLLPVLQGLFILCLAYLLVLIGIVVWTFEVSFSDGPHLSARLLLLQVGDNLDEVRFMERLVRLGYTKGPSLPRSGAMEPIRIEPALFLKHSSRK